MNIEAKYAIILIGIGALLLGFYHLNRYISMRKWGLRAEGTIYDIVEIRNNIHQTQTITGGVYVTQLIERRMEIGFVDRSNQLNIQSINVTTSHYKYKKGDVINLLYEHGNPENFMIDDGASPAYMYFLCLFPGLLFLIIGVGMIVL